MDLMRLSGYALLFAIILDMNKARGVIKMRVKVGWVRLIG